MRYKIEVQITGGIFTNNYSTRCNEKRHHPRTGQNVSSELTRERRTCLYNFKSGVSGRQGAFHDPGQGEAGRTPTIYVGTG